MNIPFCSSALHYVLLAWSLIGHGVSLAFAFMSVSHRATNRREGIQFSPALQNIWSSTEMNINPSRTKQSILYKYPMRTAQGTLCLGCESQLTVQGNNQRVFCEEYKKQKYSVWAGRRILGACTELRKATVSFFMSVCPSVLSHRTTRFPLD